MALPQTESREEIPSGQNLEDLRGQYAKLASELPEKDKKACLEWLRGDPESRDPAKLSYNLNFLQQTIATTANQFEIYSKELKDRVKQGVVRDGTEQERLKWFQGLSFVERAKILAGKDAKLDDLFDPKREENLKAFKALWEYFGSSLPHYRKFLGLELKDREKTVEDLREKKKAVESGVLPSRVRGDLQRQALDLDTAEVKKRFEQARKTHEAQKARFGKLPPVIQEEIRKEFKSLSLPEREVFLRSVDGKIKRFTAEYRGKMERMCHPNKHGLTLFRRESAGKYLEWFSKLSLRDMENMVRHDPDLDNKRRSDLVDKMTEHLGKIHVSKRAAEIEKFNSADLEGREDIVAKYERGEFPEQPQEKQGLLTRLMRKIIFSGANEKVKQTTETFAVASEMANRRERYQITHSMRDEGLDAKASAKGLSQTNEQTARVEEAMSSDRLYDAEGRRKVKLDVLETYNDDRRRLKRALKIDIDNPNASLAGDIRFRTRTGEAIRDAREYKRGELRRELDEVTASLAPEIVQEAKTEGISVSEKDIADASKKADWKNISKEIIRKSI